MKQVTLVNTGVFHSALFVYFSIFSSPLQSAEIFFDFQNADHGGCLSCPEPAEYLAHILPLSFYNQLTLEHQNTSHQPEEHEEQSPVDDQNDRLRTRSQTAFSILPRPSDLPLDSTRISLLEIDLVSGYLYESFAEFSSDSQSPLRPLSRVQLDEQLYSLSFEASYASEYQLEEGQFSWPVYLDIFVSDEKAKQIDVMNELVPALVHLDSVNGTFDLFSQITDLNDIPIRMHLSSQLTQARDGRVDAIDTQISLAIDSQQNLLLPAHLYLLLSGNQHADIAGQFHNYFEISALEDHLKIAGQFSSQPR